MQGFWACPQEEEEEKKLYFQTTPTIGLKRPPMPKQREKKGIRRRRRRRRGGFAGVREEIEFQRQHRKQRYNGNREKSGSREGGESDDAWNVWNLATPHC